MATEGEISSSFYGCSDVVYDFPCTPCSEDDKNTEAVNFCENCDTYFCETCVGLHNKVLKSHNVLEKAAMTARSSKDRSKTQSKTTTILMTDECVDHPGNVIQMYCGEHDLVCCTVCIAVDHRTCNGVDFIPKIAKGKVTDKDRLETQTALETDLKELEQLRSKKSTELMDVKNSQADILADILTFKDKIVARVNELERKSAEDVRSKCNGSVDQINSEIKQIDRLLRSTKEQMGKISNVKEKEGSQQFVSVKRGQRVMAENKETMLKLNHGSSRTFSYDFGSQLKTLLWEIDTYGSTINSSDRLYSPSITTGDSSDQLYSLSLTGEYDCKSGDETLKCMSFGTCVLENGHILMTDYRNNKLKRLDHTYKVIDSCHIVKPFAVCKTTPDEVAVSSLDMGKICFVSVSKNLSLTRTVSIGGHCMGLAYSKNELFVACGSYHSTNNALNVYNLNGVLLRISPLTASIAHLSLENDGTRIFCADKKNGLIILNRQGKNISSTSDTRLQSGHGVCHGLNGNVFVCSERGNTLLQIDRKGSVIGELLTHSDGQYEPLSVTYAQKPDRLLITSRTKPLQVYKINI